MREIKFRALKKNPQEYVGALHGKNQDNSKWVYGSGIVPIYNNTFPTNEFEMIVDVNYDELDYWQPSYSSCRIIPETVGQYTGAKDRNKKEIYEGDIVKQFADINELGNSLYYIYEIRWNKDFVAFEGIEIYSKETFLFPNLEDIEVIGNIYENKELSQNM